MTAAQIKGWKSSGFLNFLNTATAELPGAIDRLPLTSLRGTLATLTFGSGGGALMLDGFSTRETAPQWLQRTFLPSPDSGISYFAPHSQRHMVAGIHDQPFYHASKWRICLRHLSP
jgi:hypothetical protein